ncbi:thiolase family protein [Sulfoacidibacillus ferrooxidans]|uniref:3-ketoacyl-CoA thiolase n=1 Tax=Sulfoacidibacillus ferrooxidans TaxID=2005001 RepID=A0A9X1V9U7_9BACL|nr:thiolase family protein [Sulfoacidibacillus ferrooxidans]MCI0182788.1 3-ketoacyl-CoA thiolase [Sulfoacidibacillus ferrooxidans]
MFEAVIVDAIRTPIGKRNGTLKDSHPVDLLAHVLKSMIGRHPIAPERIDDVIVGCVDQVGEQAVNIGRNAWLSAGLPESVPAVTLDRQCGSSLQALHFAAQGVMSGAYDLVIAAGVESMTRIPMLQSFSDESTPLTADIAKRYHMKSGWFNQAVGAEMIAKKYGLSRTQLDEFGYRSHQLAQAARAEGKFRNEIVSVPISQDGRSLWFTDDEGIRPETNIEKMATLRPAFPGLELITAGNASQISDGASAVMIASAETAKELGLKPLARFVSFAVVGVDPVTMLTGPIPATQKVLRRAGMNISDIDLFEVNEAFASVVLAWQKEVGAPMERVNTMGGAIALGHPLGATGTRIASTIVHALQREQKQYGLIAICEGGGMANATIIERLS